jgi:FKBP-type peptidyl-prolyl cis-trans isomerase
MKFLTIALSAFFSTTAFAQTFIDAPASKDFKSMPNGILYKSIKKGSSKATAVEGDFLKLNLSYYMHRGGQKDSLIFTSQNLPEKTVQVGVVKPIYKGDLMEGMFYMAEGDSAQFIVPADSFLLKSAGSRGLPEGIRKDDKFLFCIKMIERTPKAVVEEKRKQENAKKEAEMSQKSFDEKVKRDEYLKANNISQAANPSGLIAIVSQEGAGAKPSIGQKVTVHYTGYLLDGTKFDSSVDRGQPFTFTIGKGQVIQGWDEGIALLSPGAKAKLIIPSSIGYGGRNMGSIPPYSTLIFDVELLKVE